MIRKSLYRSILSLHLLRTSLALIPCSALYLGTILHTLPDTGPSYLYVLGLKGNRLNHFLKDIKIISIYLNGIEVGLETH